MYAICPYTVKINVRARTDSNCYNRDFSVLIAEICIDELPFKMFTHAVPAAQYHCAKHDLHDDAARKVFFS